MDKNLGEQRELGNQTPQVIYTYPFPGGEGSSLGVSDAITALFSQWKLILSVFSLGLLLSSVFVLTRPEIYKVDSTISFPSDSNIAPLLVDYHRGSEWRGQSVIPTKESIFKEFGDLVLSPQNFVDFFRSTKLYVEQLSKVRDIYSDERSDQALDSVVLRKMQRRVHMSYDKDSESLNIAVTGGDQGESLNVLSGYLAYSSELYRSNLADRFRFDVARRISEVESRLSLLRSQAKFERLNEIERLKEQASVQQREIEGQIEIYLSEARKLRSTQIAEVESALKLANQLGIQSPQPTSGSLVSSGSLHLRGSRYLESEISRLTSNTYASPELTNLYIRLREAKNAGAIESLVGLKDDDAYIEVVPSLLSELERLKALKPDFGKVRPYSVDEAPVLDGIPVSPNRPMIFLICVIMSAFFALCAGLLGRLSRRS